MYPIVLEQEHIYAITMNTETHEAIVGISHSTEPGELYHLDFKTYERTKLTSVNEQWKRTITLSEATPISFNSNEGWDIPGWLMKPNPFEEGQKYPLIVITQNEEKMFANTYYHEFQFLAAHGFVVVYINSKGSHGYGQRFIDAVKEDSNDVRTILEYVNQSFNFIDRDKIYTFKSGLPIGETPLLRIQSLEHMINSLK